MWEIYFDPSLEHGNKEIIYFYGKPVGIYSVAFIPNKKIAHLSSIYIEKKYRNKGIGTRVINEIFKKCNTIKLSPLNSLEFWNKFNHRYDKKNTFMYLYK